MRIAVLGGGPGGLLAALLAKRGDPGRDVTVFERNRPGDTFGFGVVFSDATLDGIDAADPGLRRALTQHGAHWDPIEVRLRGERWRFGGNGMAAVARRTLLSLLQQRAAEAGVDLRFSAPVRPDDLGHQDGHGGRHRAGAGLDAAGPGPDDVDAALAEYEAARRPQVTRIQDAARPSLSWWEHFGRSYRSLPPWQFAFHFFSRSLPESKLRQRDPGFVDAVHRAWQHAHSRDDPLRTPVTIAGLSQPDRVVTLEDGAARLVAGQDVRHQDLTALCSETLCGEGEGEAAAPVPPDPASVAVFLLSGGTTGLPKLIARTHNDYSYNARASAELCRLDQGTVYLVSLPASHNFPLACPGILGTLLSGGRVVMLGSPDPVGAFAAIEREAVTITAVVPAVAQRWLARATELRSSEDGAGALRTLEVLQVGGARLADEPAGRIKPVLGATLQQVFGMAEGLLNYTRLDDPDEVVCGTQGRPLSPGDEIRIVDADGHDLPDGQPGALLTRGPYTPRGYYRAPEQNARAFTPDGWYASGDVVRRRPDGNLVVEGRDKDMINRGGEKISAEEVENLVYRMPGIAQVAAVAAPDAELGERICVFVVPEPGRDITLGAIRDGMAAAGVARFKWPERLEIVTELPVTKVGKLDKRALRERLKRSTP